MVAKRAPQISRMKRNRARVLRRLPDHTPRKEDQPHPLSVRQLLANPAGISLIVSSVVLFLGVLYNLGLLILFDETLVSVLTLADHVATSVHVLFTLSALCAALLLWAVMLLVLVYLFALSVTTTVYYLRAREYREKPSVLPKSSLLEREIRILEESGGRAARSLAPAIEHRHWGYFVLITMNGLTFLLIYIIAPHGASLEPLVMILTIFGILSLSIYGADWSALLDWGPYPKLVGGLILVYLLPFQLGIFEAVTALNFVLDPQENQRAYSVGRLNDEAHLLKTGSAGVFYVVRPETPSDEAVLRFEPWSKIGRVGLRIGEPPVGSSQPSGTKAKAPSSPG